jgi:hypothetical protein
MRKFRRFMSVAVVAGMTVMVGVPSTHAQDVQSAAAAKPIKYKGTGTQTFISAYFSYDENGPATLSTGSGKDNSGPYTFQCVTQVTNTATACTAPDSTPGIKSDLVASDCIATFGVKGQAYSHAGAQTGVQCTSLTTGVFTSTIIFNSVGGSGKFTAPLNGDISSTTNGVVTAAPNGGASGVFGGGSFINTGTLTK